MATPVTMPVLGLTMEEGTVAEWLKAEGDQVARDEPLLMVEMDKGTVEVPAPASGVLRRIAVQPGTTVPVKTVIAEIAAVGETDEAERPAGGPGDLTREETEAPRTATREPAALESAATAERIATTERAAAATPRAQTVNTPGPQTVNAPGPQTVNAPHAESRRLFVTPRARLRAREIGVDLAAIRGTGPHGRIVEADVLAVAPQPARQPQTSTSTTTTGVEPLTRMRRITSERMAASAQAAARVTLFLEAELSEAVRFRRQLEPELARLGVERLPWDAIVARAAALALAEHKNVLAQWVDGQGLRPGTEVNIGVAVTLEPEGLVVPVLRNADHKSLRELAAELLELVGRARANRLSPAEMQGGTFSITNLGGYRIDGFTPILNPPETAILGVGRIAEKPLVVDGRIEARTLCTLSLSFDHRVIDGAPAAAFLARLAELLERPYALLGI